MHRKKPQNVILYSDIPKTEIIDYEVQKAIPMPFLKGADSVCTSYPELPTANPGQDDVGNWVDTHKPANKTHGSQYDLLEEFYSPSTRSHRSNTADVAMMQALRKKVRERTVLGLIFTAKL